MLLTVPCLAAEGGGDGAELPNLPPGAETLLSGLSPGDADLNEGLRRILLFIQERLRGLVEEALRPMAAVLAVPVLCALGTQLQSCGENRMDYVTLGGVLSLSCAAAADVKSALVLGNETVGELAEYARLLLPALTSAAVSAGAVSSAGVKYAAAALLSDLLLRVSRDLIMPLICGYTAAAISRAAMGTEQLNGVLDLLRLGTQKLMKWMVLAFTGYLSFAGLSSGAADRAAIQAAKTALTAALPVVGKTLSEASSSLIAGAGVIRSSLGLFGLLAVLAAVVLPLLRIGIRYLLYQAAAAVAGIFAGGRLEKLLKDIGNAYGMVFGLVGMASAFYLLAIVALMQSVTG